MAFPADVTLVRVHGTFSRADGVRPVGKVVFTPSTGLVSAATGTMIRPTAIVATIGVDGSFSAMLPATDDPDITPSGWTYQVREELRGTEPRIYAINVPASAADSGGLSLADIAPVAPSTGETSYVLLSAYTGLQSRVVALEAQVEGADPDHLPSRQWVGYGPPTDVPGSRPGDTYIDLASPTLAVYTLA